MALKQATGKYGGVNGTTSGNTSANGSRRGSSAYNFGSAFIGISALAGIGSVAERKDSATPSPRNSSQISLQDSGYAEPMNAGTGSYSSNNSQQQREKLVGSTPQLNLYATNRPYNNGIKKIEIFLK